jgi:RNA-directed DNA polymerase
MWSGPRHRPPPSPPLGMPRDFQVVRDPIAGTEASACWLGSQQRDAGQRVALAPSVRALRGDDYRDLARAVGSMATVGDGALDPARLRSRYRVDRGPWLRMVTDLLGQVVADAGSVERASAVLTVPLDHLAGWVRRMVSRGCPNAAASRWPTAAVTDAPEAVAYLDLVEAAERGAIDGDNAIGSPGVREFYTVRTDKAPTEACLAGLGVSSWSSLPGMRAALSRSTPADTLWSEAAEGFIPRALRPALITKRHYHRGRASSSKLRAFSLCGAGYKLNPGLHLLTHMHRKLDQSAALAVLHSLRTRQDVAAFFDVSIRRFDYHLYVRPQAYRRIELPKKSGGVRTIHSPPKLIGIFQTKLANHLRDAYRRKTNVFGFCLDGGVVRNAKPHVRARHVLNLDLVDFFDEITFFRVFGMFKSPPLALPDAPAAMLAHLCCWNKRLPQGAPTSPIVSNWICRNLDNMLSRLARKHRCTYTRYADDITFSTRRGSFPSEVVKYRLGDQVELGDALTATISLGGFHINTRKVWVRSSDERQVVTGIIVNEKTNVPRHYRRSVRAALHNWEAQGLVNAQSKLEGFYARPRRRAYPPSLPNYLGGKLEFLRQVKGSDDPIYVKYALQLERLCRRDTSLIRPVRLQGQPALEQSNLAEALWIIRGRDKVSGSEWTGTGFSVARVGVVTNWHVMSLDHDYQGYREYEEFGSLEAGDFEFHARPATGGAWQEISVVKKSQHHDLAIIAVQTPSVAELEVQRRDVILGDEILVAGFPNWSEGDKPRLERATVTNLRMRSAVQWFQVSGSIESGNSGGPVLNVQGRVVGVATRGKDAADPFPNGAVAIDHLKDCF